MFQITSGILCFRANNPSPMTLDGTNCYLVAGPRPEGPAEALLIDVGPDDPAHLAAMAGYLRERRLQLRGILLTHTHRDHTAGLPSFRQKVQAPIYAYQAGYDRLLREGDRIPIGGDTLLVVYSPGHAGDCVCFYLEAEGVLFTGDTVLGTGTSVISPPEGDVSQYLDTLERLKALPARLIAPGHGPVVAEPHAKLAEYIEHRLMRERQILAQLQTGLKSVGELVTEIYKDVDPGLHGAAAWSVSAHLERLKRAGKVTQQGDRFGARREA